MADSESHPPLVRHRTAPRNRRSNSNLATMSD